MILYPSHKCAKCNIPHSILLSSNEMDDDKDHPLVFLGNNLLNNDLTFRGFLFLIALTKSIQSRFTSVLR